MLFGLPENARIIQQTLPIVRYREKLEIVIRRPFESFYYLRNSKNGIQQTPISLIPIGHVTGIHSENLFYALQDESSTIGYRTGSSKPVKKMEL
jgi:thiamine pyrophosphokinase